ncbi:MAG: DUF4954 family protein, partial [Candidatus Krumholzibacteria bacterium]|nr:DUF4954 family protein [Candidatus Krumholzibacteria bacterium]
MNELLKSLVADLLETSGFLASMRGLKGARGRSRLFGDQVRPLTAGEIDALRAGGNRSADWGRILVAERFSPEHIFGSAFRGDCVLGVLSGEEVPVESAASLPCGIYNSTIVCCEIGDGCLVSDASLISNYILRERCVVLGAGSVVASPDCSFGNGREIAIGIETGGREVLSYAEITIPVAAAVATRRGDREFLGAYREFAKSYIDFCSAPFGVIERGAVVRHTPRVENAYVGEGALIDGATLVRDCTILSAPDERTAVRDGAYARNSCLQQGCEAASMAIVDDSVLTE